MADYYSYITMLIAIIIAVFMIKKFVGCAIRAIITVALMIVLAYIYIMYLR